MSDYKFCILLGRGGMLSSRRVDLQRSTEICWEWEGGG